MPSKCAKAGCPRQPLAGSRCILHWMKRRAAYKSLPRHTRWWKSFEPVFVMGLELRQQGLVVGIPVFNLLPMHEQYRPLLEQLTYAVEEFKDERKGVATTSGTDGTDQAC